jgi:transcriptional regulator with XRE-family HTH domain
MEKTIYSKEYRGVVHRLQKARKEAGLTQVEVAKLLKKPQSYVSKVESGEQRLDVVEMRHFAAIYKQPISYFISS